MKIKDNLYCTKSKFVSGSHEYSLGWDFSGSMPIVIAFQHAQTYRSKKSANIKRIPGAWKFQDIYRCDKLWIDGNQNWYIKPKFSDWQDLKDLYDEIMKEQLLTYPG